MAWQRPTPRYMHAYCATGTTSGVLNEEEPVVRRSTLALSSRNAVWQRKFVSGVPEFPLQSRPAGRQAAKQAYLKPTDTPAVVRVEFSGRIARDWLILEPRGQWLRSWHRGAVKAPPIPRPRCLRGSLRG